MSTDTPLIPESKPADAAPSSPSGSFSFTVEGPAQVTQSQGVLATAVTQSQSPINGRDVSAEDVVSVGEIEILVGEAERMGFLARDAHGRYIDVSPEDAEKAHAEANKPEEATQEVDLSEALEFEPGDMEEFARFGSQLEEVGGDSVSALAQYLTRPDQLPDAVAVMAEERGISEEVARAKMDVMAAKVDDALSDYLITRADISPEQIDEFWQFVKADHMSKYAAVIVQAVFVGNGRPLKELADTFRIKHGSGVGRATPDMIDTVIEDGREVRYVTLNGRRMSLEAARRNKLL